MMITRKTSKFVIFMALIALFCSPAYTSDNEVPTEKIQQFIDVYKKIKDQYVDDPAQCPSKPNVFLAEGHKLRTSYAISFLLGNLCA